MLIKDNTLKKRWSLKLDLQQPQTNLNLSNLNRSSSEVGDTKNDERIEHIGIDESEGNQSNENIGSTGSLQHSTQGIICVHKKSKIQMLSIDQKVNCVPRNYLVSTE